MVKETGKLTRNVIGPKIVLVQSNNESTDVLMPRWERKK